jgi:fusaric acid resistance family protein
MILQDLRLAFAAYRSDELPRMQHALKAALAAVISMVVCMRLELRGPGTAMVSAVIVMAHQQSGMVIARAFYRALGIFFGSIAGLTRMCAFPQQPPLFLAGLALWIGLFVTGASYYRNFQSCGFVLSGYAAGITNRARMVEPLRRRDQRDLYRQRRGDRRGQRQSCQCACVAAARDAVDRQLAAQRTRETAAGAQPGGAAQRRRRRWEAMSIWSGRVSSSSSCVPQPCSKTLRCGCESMR